MDILKIIFLSISSAVTLYFLTKLMGNKEMSQLTMFDYIIGITIGSIAAEMSTALESNFMQPLVAMIVYALISIAISIISCKSIKFRRALYGNSLILYDNGKIFFNNLKKSKIDINEFLMQCRVNGFFNLNSLQTAILEINGKISFLPKETERPVTPKDLNLSPLPEKVCINIILDGTLLKENLYYTGNDEIWLQKQLVSNNIKDIKDVFLAICDSQNYLTLYLKDTNINSNNFFE